ncbi:uncharacterized protein LOC142486007 [Ascaphus truei]|uniref:uncharacterized protein LOC142486007 n=1 Tax=Ascaphus truei TaxID=8439 RepID=UPI003F592323
MDKRKDTLVEIEKKADRGDPITQRVGRSERGDHLTKAEGENDGRDHFIQQGKALIGGGRCLISREEEQRTERQDMSSWGEKQSEREDPTSQGEEKQRTEREDPTSQGEEKKRTERGDLTSQGEEKQRTEREDPTSQGEEKQRTEREDLTSQVEKKQRTGREDLTSQGEEKQRTEREDPTSQGEEKQRTEREDPTSQGEEKKRIERGDLTSQGEEEPRTERGYPTSQREEKQRNERGDPTSQGEEQKTERGDLTSEGEEEPRTERGYPTSQGEEQKTERGDLTSQGEEEPRTERGDPTSQGEEKQKDETDRRRETGEKTEGGNTSIERARDPRQPEDEREGGVTDAVCETGSPDTLVRSVLLATQNLIGSLTSLRDRMERNQGGRRLVNSADRGKPHHESAEESTSEEPGFLPPSVSEFQGEGTLTCYSGGCERGQEPIAMGGAGSDMEERDQPAVREEEIMKRRGRSAQREDSEKSGDQSTRDPLVVFNRCLSELLEWMSSSWLRSNPDETEVLVVDAHRRKTTSLQLVHHTGLKLGSYQLLNSVRVRNLGVVLDLYRAPRLIRFSSIHFVSSRLDYCNALYLGLPETELRCLQLVQNAT